MDKLSNAIWWIALSCCLACGSILIFGDIIFSLYFIVYGIDENLIPILILLVILYLGAIYLLYYGIFGIRRERRRAKGLPLGNHPFPAWDRMGSYWFHLLDKQYPEYFKTNKP